MAGTALDFSSRPADLAGPTVGAAAVTVSDTVDDPAGPFRRLWIVATGALKVTMLDGSVMTFPAAPVGLLELAVRRIWSTGTTIATPNSNVIGLR